jgi:hypothetical protein
MAEKFTQHGEQKYIFSFDGQSSTAAATAIETSTGIAPQELDISGEPEFTSEAEGPDGMVKAVAVGFLKRSFTLTGYLTDKAKFDEEGNTFTHDGKTFIVMNRRLTKNTRQFQKAELTGMSWDGVTAS